mmetsp:Transcript_21049/g.66152  ORF Transcript_21049/g.66152 Transcript_21049/m.66152 type:complete len:243 (-) Transcript_21049:64-792(-)
MTSMGLARTLTTTSMRMGSPRPSQLPTTTTTTTTTIYRETDADPPPGSSTPTTASCPTTIADDSGPESLSPPTTLSPTPRHFYRRGRPARYNYVFYPSKQSRLDPFARSSPTESATDSPRESSDLAPPRRFYHLPPPLSHSSPTDCPSFHLAPLSPGHTLPIPHPLYLLALKLAAATWNRRRRLPDALSRQRALRCPRHDRLPSRRPAPLLSLSRAGTTRAILALAPCASIRRPRSISGSAF